MKFWIFVEKIAWNDEPEILWRLTICTLSIQNTIEIRYISPRKTGQALRVIALKADKLKGNLTVERR
jgi:hypothetical protein